MPLQQENPKTPRAFRLDLWVNSKRETRARKNGKTPTVVAFLGYGHNDKVRVLGRTLLLGRADSYDTQMLQGQFQDRRVRGWRSFTSVPAANEKVEVVVDDKTLGSTVTDSGGVLDDVFEAQLSPGWHRASFITSSGNTSHSEIFVTAPSTTFGIISDVDDTILNTVLPSPLVAAWNSFIKTEHARLAPPGMPVLLDHLSTTHPDSPVIYLSTGAWNVAPALGRFMARHMYPRGPLLLTDWGPTQERFFRSGSEHKRRELRRLAREMPDVKWLLIGDDGQHDEDIYHEFTREYPEHVAAVAIRQLSIGEAVLAGGRSKAAKHRAVSGVPWVYGPDGATLRAELSKLGIV